MPNSSGAAPRAKQPRALIVEDDPVSRSILQKFLHGMGWQAEAYADAESAQAVLSSHAFDLAFVDWNLPHASGLDFVKSARRLTAAKSFKIMMVTAENDLAHIREALSQGADEFLMKPYTREMLDFKLRMLGWNA